LAQEYSLPDSGVDGNEPLVNEVASELANTSPYLNIEYPCTRVSR